MRFFLKIQSLGLLALFLGFFAFHAAATTYYVDINSPNPTPPYTNWATASTDIQSAVNQTVNGDTVLVNPGVYQSGSNAAPDGNLSCVVITNAITLQSVNGPGNTLIQGYSNTNGIIQNDNVRCIYMATNATLLGFTLTNGATPGNGGGVYCQSTACQVSNCVMVGNAADDGGGGAYSGTLESCILMNNNAYGNDISPGGGGAYGSTLVNCTVLDNYTLTSGGGAANALIYSSLVISNFAGLYVGSAGNGGGVYDCTNFSSAIADNYAENEGGGAYGGILLNCTITKNAAYEDGGGTESCLLTNCIIYYNQIFYNGNATNVDGGSCSYCCTTPFIGTKCVTSDPQLSSISHISFNSPCRGAGNPLVTSSTDIDGNPWANPPSIGCSEPYPGNDFGNLTVGISAPFTNWAPGYALNLQANISGPVYSNVWNLGDGTLITNQAYISHSWSNTGLYTVTLTAYNDSYPTGVTATLPVTIAVPSVYYVNLDSPNPAPPQIPPGSESFENPILNGPNPLPPYISWSTAASDIQDAVNAATPGSVVLVTNGPTWPTYGVTNSAAYYISSGTAAPNGQTYCVVVIKPITVESVNGPATTYIWGTPPSHGSSAGCVYLTNGATLSGFTLTNGAGGIYCVSTNAVVTNCLVTHCNGAVWSGTLYNCTLAGNFSAAYNASTMFNCVISNNTGGGVIGGILNNCLIVTNTATKGGGILAEAGYPALLNNCIISNNIASQNGGGVYNNGPFTNCILNHCTLVGNSANQYGGGALNAELNNCLIISNSDSGVCGGLINNCVIAGNSFSGVFAEAGYPAVLNNCLISNNIAGQGGGVDNFYAPPTNCILNNCTLILNSAGEAGGGAFDAELNNCLIISNQVVSYEGPCAGGGVEGGILNDCVLIGNSLITNSSGYEATGGGADGGNSGGHAFLTNCVLIANTAQLGGGASSSTLVNCTVVSNSASQAGGGIAGCVADNCILYYNMGGDYVARVYTISTNNINFSCTALMPTNGSRNITFAPLFVNPAGGDYHLQPTSPCINSGNNAYVTSATDLDGNPRIVGGTVDIGCYEYQSPTSVISYAWLQQYGLPTDGSVDFADLDGTAFSVYQDWIAGLNPTNSTSVLAMITPTATNNANGITVTWQSVSGITYFLQRSTNLFAQPTFLTIQNNITGQTNTTSYTDTTATNNFPYFYRVGVLAP